MNREYTAQIYSEEKIVAHRSGHDIEQLYIWMLAKVDGLPGAIRGEIIDIETKEIVKCFKKTSME